MMMMITNWQIYCKVYRSNNFKSRLVVSMQLWPKFCGFFAGPLSNYETDFWARSIVHRKSNAVVIRCRLLRRVCLRCLLSTWQHGAVCSMIEWLICWRRVREAS